VEPLPIVRPGDRPSAAHLNALGRVASRDHVTGVDGLVAIGNPLPSLDAMEIFEITTAPTWDSDRSLFYAVGKRVHPTSVTYDVPTGAITETLWLPTAVYGNWGDLELAVTFGVGKRVLTVQPMADRWIIGAPLTAHSTRTYVKCQSHWAAPTGGDLFPTVSVKHYNLDTASVTGSAFDALIACPWDSTYLTSPAPELFEGDIVQADLDYYGDWQICGPLGFSRLKSIQMYTGSATNIPQGFALADGSAVPAADKTGESNVPDLSGKFVLGVDTDGRADEDAIGDTGGYRWHGETENNHADHDNHQHNIRMTSMAQENVDVGTAFKTWDIDSSADPETSGVEVTDGSPTSTDILNHKGTIDNSGYYDTDNRPPYYALAFIWRCY